uniref:Uncharacterized protein n=1 Tax=Neolamprologus brichardi TaxID=32507 RepID=A0A3Q4H8H9_NEOBR
MAQGVGKRICNRKVAGSISGLSVLVVVSLPQGRLHSFILAFTHWWRQATVTTDPLPQGGLTVACLPTQRAHLFAAALQSAARCWSVACDHWSLVALSPLLVRTHSHTLASHTCMLKLNHSHGDLCTHTHTHSHMNTHTSSLLTCRCAPLWSRHAFHSWLLLWGPCVPFMTAVTWSMSTFELKLSSRAHMLPKSLL